MKITGYDSQIKELVNAAKDVTIIANQTLDQDILGAIISLKNYLSRRSKKVHVFIPHINKVQGEEPTELSEFEELPAQRTTIRINLNEKRIKKFSYEVKEGYLNVYLIPEKGLIQGSNVEVNNEQIQTDIIFTIGLSRPEDVDIWPITWSEDYKLRTPIINIDNNSQNTQYGSINIVEDSISMSKCMYTFMKEVVWEIDILSAQYLLNGIKNKTVNFSLNTTSEIFMVAADLTKIIEKAKKDE